MTRVLIEFLKLFLQLLAIAEIVLSSLKIDSGSYGQIKEGFEMPTECLEADNNKTWWCKVIKNDDNSQCLYLLSLECNP